MTPRNLGNLIDRNTDPERVVVIDIKDPANPFILKCGTLVARIDAVARSITARGFEKGDAVAILSANSADYLCAYFGVMRAGLVAVPLSYKFPVETIRYMLADCGAKLVIADKDRAQYCPEEIPIIQFDDEGSNGFETFLNTGSFDCVETNGNDIAMILYTSGSTGRPKGVPLTHAGQLWVINNIIGDGSSFKHHRFLVAAPLFHMNGLLMSKVVAASQASQVLMPQFNALHYIRAIEEYRCSYLTSVPTMIALVAKETDLLDEMDLTSVEHVMMGSAPLTQPLIDKVKEIFPQTAIYNAYGTTEAGAGTFGVHPEQIPKPQIALGYPAPGVEARLVEGVNTDASEGVLQLKTPALMPGYLNLPERTSQSVSVDGWYDTGDIMRRDQNGFYYFVGRADDMFICGGENIYPGEVEKMLERHASIHQACVVPVEDSIRGAKPVAFIVGTPGSSLTEQEVKDFALKNAPPQQHPRNVEFLEYLPLAGTNKIDRKTLIDKAKIFIEI